MINCLSTPESTSPNFTTVADEAPPNSDGHVPIDTATPSSDPTKQRFSKDVPEALKLPRLIPPPPQRRSDEENRRKPLLWNPQAASREPGNGSNCQRININQISMESSPRVRAEVNDAVAKDYAERMHEGDVFPPIVVFFDGKDYVLADGFHRVTAAQIYKRTTIDADVRRGTRSDALKCALLANVAHGLRRTNQDKRHAVTLALQEFSDESDRAIAGYCAVDPELVGVVRRQLSVSDNSPKQTRRKGRDGKSYSAKGSRKDKTAKVAVESVAPPSSETQARHTAEVGDKVTQPSLQQRLENFRSDIATILNDYPDKAPVVALNLEVILKNTRQFIANRSANIVSMPQQLSAAVISAKG